MVSQLLETEILKLQNTADKERLHSVPVQNVSKKFDGLLIQWWRHFGLSGKGMVVGDGGFCDPVKNKLRELFPEIGSVEVADMRGADIIWDITKPPGELLSSMYDWIICQATLEHVYDPVASIKNMLSCLKPSGLLYIHTVGPQMKIHRHPVDCIRFLRDFFVILEHELETEIVDMLWTPYHINVIYRRV